jgi:hypothetical protein
MRNSGKPRPFFLFLAAAVALAAILAGCDTPFAVSNTTILVPIAGGEKVEVTYGKAGPVMLAKDGVQVEADSLDLSADKKHLVYVFKLLIKNGAPPQRVTVSDLTDDPVQLILEDRAPHLTAGHWVAARVDRGAEDPSLAWVKTLDDSMRIYRIAITLADGTPVVLDQPVSYPGYFKGAIRKTIGMDY